MFDYRLNKSATVGIKNRSYRAICPDCGGINNFIADGDIVLYDVSTDMASSGRTIIPIDDISIDLQINMLCKSCRDKNGNKDNLVIDNFAIYRMFSALNRFDHSGIGNNNWCELCKTPKVIDGQVVNSYVMPSVRYILNKNKKTEMDSILDMALTDPSIVEGTYTVLGCENYEDSTPYYSIELFLDQSSVAMIYDPEKDGDYIKFCNNLFIRKIDRLARLIELATP